MTESFSDILGDSLLVNGLMDNKVNGKADYILPDDICRCHDDECHRKENCLRYLHRDRARSESMVVSFSESLRQGQWPCFYFIAAEE